MATGFSPGKGATFTPSARAKWTDEFNEILNGKDKLSRNQLVEMLILEALNMRKNGNINLSEQEIQIVELLRNQNFTKSIKQPRAETFNNEKESIEEPFNREVSSTKEEAIKVESQHKNEKSTDSAVDMLRQMMAGHSIE